VKSIADRLQDVSKRISSAIIPGDAVLLQVVSKRAVFAAFMGDRLPALSEDAARDAR
jgi:hypothetical protein